MARKKTPKETFARLFKFCIFLVYCIDLRRDKNTLRVTNVGSFWNKLSLRRKEVQEMRLRKFIIWMRWQPRSQIYCLPKWQFALLNQPQGKTILSNETCLKHCFRVKGFFIFMTMLSFKQVKSNYGKEEPCERGCCWIIKFSHCLNFGYQKYAIIIFFNSISEWLYNLHTRRKKSVARMKKKICEVNNLWYFLRRVNFILKS